MAKNQHTRRKIFLKILSMNVSSSQIGHDFSNKVVQKLTIAKKSVFNKKWSPKLIFLNEKKKRKEKSWLIFDIEN